MSEVVGVTSCGERMLSGIVAPQAIVDETLLHLGFVHLIRRISAASPGAPAIGGLGPAVDEAVRLRAALHVGFPAGEVDEVEEVEQVQEVERDPQAGGRRWKVSVNLPALYGPSSPLPAYMTERLMREDPSGLARAFIDVINHRLLSLLYRVVDRHGPSRLGMAPHHAVAAMLGLDHQPDLMPYAALVRGQQRSADDLVRLLRHRFAPFAIDVEQCVAADTLLTEERLAHLGTCNHRLGFDCVLGDSVTTRATRFRISMADVPVERMRDLLPGGTAHADLRAIVTRFNPGALDWDLDLELLGATVEVATLGGTSACLGRGVRLAGEAASAYRVRVEGAAG